MIGSYTAVLAALSDFSTVPGVQGEETHDQEPCNP